MLDIQLLEARRFLRFKTVANARSVWYNNLTALAAVNRRRLREQLNGQNKILTDFERLRRLRSLRSAFVV